MSPLFPWLLCLALAAPGDASPCQDEEALGLSLRDELLTDVSLLQLSVESESSHLENLTEQLLVLDGVNADLQVADLRELYDPRNANISLYIMCFMLIPFAGFILVAPNWLLVSMIGCLDSLCTELPVAIFPLLAPDFLSVAALVAAKPLMQALTAPFSMRYVRSRELFFTELGLSLEISALLLQALMPSFSFFCIARGIQGMASALIIQASPRIASRFEAAPSGMAVKFIYAGLVCGTPFGALTFAVEPFLPFLWLALAEMVLLIAVFLSWRGLAEEEAKPDAATLMSVISDSVTLRPILLVSLLLMFTGALQTVSMRMLQQEYDFSVIMSGMTWMFQSWPSVFLVFALGPVARFIGFRLVMLGSLILAGTAAMLAREGSLAILILELFFSGVAAGCTNSVVPRMLEDVSDRRYGDEEKVFSIMNLFQQIGYVLGPVLGATVMTFFGFQAMCRTFGVGLLSYALFHTIE